MENNFYVGIVVHQKRKPNQLMREKLILYTSDQINYIDLISNMSYPLEGNSNDKKDYIEASSLINVDISDYRTDYLYLLDRYNENREKNNTKKRKYPWIKN